MMMMMMMMMMVQSHLSLSKPLSLIFYKGPKGLGQLKSHGNSLSQICDATLIGPHGLGPAEDSQQQQQLVAFAYDSSKSIGDKVQTLQSR